MSEYFFYNTCPKCKKSSPLEITKWNLASFSFHDGKELVSELIGFVNFTLFCKSCRRGIAGVFEYGTESGHPHDLCNYDKKGDKDLSDFFSNIYNDFRFDISPFCRAGIYNEAFFCYEGGAYTAAAILCRTAIDVRIDAMWRNSENIDKKNKSLYDKIHDLFPDKDNSIQSNISHIIRLIGNETVHEGIEVKKEDAELWLKLTEKFLSATDGHDLGSFRLGSK